MLLGSALHTGGAERVMAHLVRNLDPARYRVTVCHLMNRGKIGDELADDGFDVVGVPRERRPLLRYLTYRNLQRVLAERRVDLIHTHSHYAVSDATLCRMLTPQRFKLVHTFHFGNYPHIPRRYRWIEWAGTRAADRLVAVGVEQAKAVRATYDLAAGRVGVIVNGAELGTGSVDPEWTRRLVGTGKVVIGTICTFIEQKGLPHLLQAAARLKQQGVPATFVIVGDGHLRSSIEDRCRADGLADDVLFTGHVDRAAARVLPLFDIFFQPSLWEAMSMVIVEAMAAGKPVVATDVGDNRHVVVDGATGYVVAKGDIAAMADALARLVADPGQRRSFGEAAVCRYREKYTVSSMVNSYDQLYSDLLMS